MSKLPTSDHPHEAIETFYCRLDERFATLALTAPLHGMVPADVQLDRPDFPVTIKYQNNNYLVPPPEIDEEYKRFFNVPDKEFELNPDQTTRGLPELEYVDIEGDIFYAEQLVQNRAYLVETYLIKTIGEQGLKTLRDASSGIGLGRDNYIYRAPYSKVRMTELGSMLVNSLDPSANFESQSMYDADSSQVRHFAEEPKYSGEIIRVRIEEPAFYTRAGMGVARVRPLFPHYVISSQIDVSQDLGQSWYPIADIKD